MKKRTLLSLLTLSAILILTAAFKPSSQPTSSENPFTQLPRPKELKLLRAITLNPPDRNRFDPSGLTFSPTNNLLLTANDKLQYPAAFSIQIPPPSQRETDLTPFFKKKIKLKKIYSPHWKNIYYYLDLEGISLCKNSLLMISEQRREIFRLDLKTKKLTRHPISLANYERKTALSGRPLPRFSTWFNAGYEGIACDPKRKRIFIAQERQPRLIFALKFPKEWKEQTPLEPYDHFDLPSYGLPKKFKGFDLEPDFAGLDFKDGTLFALYRSARMLLAVNPETRKLKAAYSYYSSTKKLYKNNYPFGLAEGIAITKQYIWIIIDNNGLPRENTTRDRRPTLLQFKNPEGAR